jgi:hypothetical protein
MSAGFKLLYFLNLLVLVVALLLPIGELIGKDGSYDKMMFGYYVLLMAGSVTVCITFLLLNIYGLVKYKRYRARFLVATILDCGWIVVGSYQLVYAYMHDVVI